MSHLSSFLPVHQLLAKKSTAVWASYWNLAQDAKIRCYPSYVAALVKAITVVKAKRVFILSKDRAYFLAGFLASLHAGVPIVLPPLGACGLLKELMQPGDCLLTDQSDIMAVAPLLIAMDRVTADDDCSTYFTLVDPANAWLIFYTSGSTGSPKRVEKSLMQLETEIAALQNMWSGFKGAFLSTVSHQHIYGLLFSLLWPVCSGYPLKRQTFLFWEDLLDHCDSGDCIVSSPSHLGRFPLLTNKASNISRVFSSGGALSLEAAQATHHFLGVLPTEIYGSTETGGIAYRQQLTHTMPWTRFPNIELSVKDGQRLRIKSPYLSDNDWHQTEDCVSLLNENEFHWVGRADRVVKVEGKRVCLLELEQRLMSLEFIKEAALFLLKDDNREALGAVVVLSPEGQEKLLSSGKIQLVRELRSNLSPYLERVAIPRKWRFVSQLPVNSQGKRINNFL